ncbi:MAG: toxic anion resistance protein [Lachnospiraceae bacterium]|nr:toxic anion resistance protein [Lachnospiraceae bacterium]
MGFSLELPSEEEVKQEVVEAIAPTPKEEAAIENMAGDRAKQIMEVDLDNIQERREYVEVIEKFGLDEMKTVRNQNAILNQRIGMFEKQGGESGDVAKGLSELTIKMKDLDPSGIDFVKSGPLGKLFNPVRRYFEKYKTADQEIADIVKSLEKGKHTLQNDNITLETEEGELRQMVKKMKQNIEIGVKLDESVSSQIEAARVSGTDPEKIKFVEEEILFPLRQRIEDFQQVLTVGQQGIIAMNIIRKNNKELIRSVDRAENVTVTALRTAVTVAGALYNQKIVLEKVNALNETTNHMIAATSKMLKEQGAEIQKQASEAMVSPEVLQQSFNDTMEALEDLSRYRQEALPVMKKTIDTFRELAEIGEAQIEKMDRALF